MHLKMEWTPAVQTIWVDGKAFQNVGESITDPCHDLAHLLAAACGLPWDPTNHEDGRHRLAELNAVLIEHCLWQAQRVKHISADYLRVYADWFIDEHYAPFPISKGECLERFRTGLNMEKMIRLSPLFFHMQGIENQDWGNVRQKEWRLEFNDDDRPEASRLDYMHQVMAFRIMANFFSQ